MSDQSSSILIFGAEAVPRSSPVGTPGGSSRVPVEATAASLKAVMEQVRNLIWAAKDAPGELRIAHVDVSLAIAADGSVGLLGTAGGSTGAKGTLTVRLQL